MAKNLCEIVDGSNASFGRVPSESAALAAARVMCKEYGKPFTVRTTDGLELFKVEPTFTVKTVYLIKTDVRTEKK